MGQFILISKEDGVATVTFHRPEARNALNSQVLYELAMAVDDVEADDGVRVVVFTGEGKSFISGADVAELSDLRGIDVINYSRKGRDLFRRIELLAKPTIAAVNGYALGGGVEFVLCTDIRIACERATFAMPEATLGIVPGFNGTQRLPRTVGVSKAKELLFTGRRICADEALSLGIVNQVATEAEFCGRVKETARTIADNSSSAIALIKTAIQAGVESNFDTAKEVEMGYMAACFGTRDQTEGLAAFLEKRKPDFRKQ